MHGDLFEVSEILRLKMKEVLIGAGCSGGDLAATNSVGLGRGGLIQEIDYAYTIDEIEFDNDEGSSEATENDDCGIIENVLHKNVAEDQIYINKETIASVMKNYAFHKKFQFKVKRSSATRTMLMTSNIAKSMYSTSKFARELPVRRLLEYLTKLMTQWSYENRKCAMKSTELGKMYNKMLKKNMLASQNMTAIPSTVQLYTVVEGKQVIKDNGMDPIQFCSFYYNKVYLIKTWEISVNPILDETTWLVWKTKNEEIQTCFGNG
ncbi:hypothetical protein RND71_039766 [Anisodus tanguticus]|uniref:Uncharacterized protein n=1 Tax=Anisodus tanguticus TaxID=243964 RepID=A0AAE1QX75_9SOLA|nr:hypothetical protein RND71_039766 [Anisodus tanguticus]